MHYTAWYVYMKIRVGRLRYLNSEPFYYEMVRDDIELYPMVPSAISPALEQDEIDAAPLPLVDYFRLQDRFGQLGQFCIATMEKARSVLLYSKRPVEDLEGATVGVTGETSTSRRLLEVLLTHKFQVKPASYVTLDEPSDAFLLIGDDALRRRHGFPSYDYRYDLGEEWYRWTRMPFVFALWVIRRDMSKKQASYLENVLYSCIDEGMEHMYTIGQMREDVRMSSREIMEYFQGFRYWAGVGEQKAIRHFKGYLNSLDTLGRT